MPSDYEHNLIAQRIVPYSTHEYLAVRILRSYPNPLLLSMVRRFWLFLTPKLKMIVLYFASLGLEAQPQHTSFYFTKVSRLITVSLFAGTSQALRNRWNRP